MLALGVPLLALSRHGGSPDRCPVSGQNRLAPDWSAGLADDPNAADRHRGRPRSSLADGLAGVRGLVTCSEQRVSLSAPERPLEGSLAVADGLRRSGLPLPICFAVDIGDLVGRQGNKRVTSAVQQIPLEIAKATIFA